MKIVAFEVEVGGIKGIIDDQESLKKAVKETNAEFALAKFGTDAYEKQAKQLAILKNLQKDLRQEQRKAGRDAVIAADQGTDSYRAQAAQLVNLRNRFKDLSKEERESSVGVAILKNIQALDTELKEVDATMGNFQRNVGNYADTIFGATKKQEGLTKELAKLRAEWKALPKEITNAVKAQEGFNAKVKELEGEIEELAKVTGKAGDDYEDTFLDKIAGTEGVLGDVGSGVKGLGNSFKALLANPVVAFFALLAAALTAIVGAFTKTERGANLLAKGSAVLSGIMSELVGVVDAGVTSLLAFAEDPLQGIQDLGQALLDNVLNRFSGLITLAGLAGQAVAKLATGDLEGLKKVAGEAGQALTQITTGLDPQQQADFAKSVAETTKEISLNIDAWAKLGAARRAIIVQNLELQKSLEPILTQEALLQKISDDNTKSFKEREAAAEASRKATEARGAIEAKIARNNLSIINQELALRQANGEQVDDLLQQQLGGIQAVAGAERELTLTIAENEKTRAELKQDRLERDLDILLDGFDNQKTINERIIANEKETIDKRQALLAETAQLGTESFDKQIETIQKFTGIALDSNALVTQSDAIRLNEQIRSLGLSEIIEGRLLEVIRDRKTELNDLKEAQEDLNDASAEVNIQGIEAARDAQIQALLLVGEVTEEVTRKRVDIEREAERDILRAKLATAEAAGEVGNADAAAARLQLLEQEIAASKLAEERKLADKVEAIEKEKNLKLKALFEEEDISKITSERIQAIKLDAEIAGIQTRLDIEKLSAEERLAIETDLAEKKLTLLQDSAAATQIANKQIFDGIALGLSATQQAIQQASTFSNIRLENETRAINDRYDAEIEAAGENAELISQIEEERDAELEEVQRKAFERQKKLQIATALVSGAQAIISTLAAVPGPIDIASLGAFRIAQIALAAATTAAQIAAINKTSFADGGYTGRGYGRPDSTGFRQAGVVHEGEYVVPKNVLLTPGGARLVRQLDGMRTGNRAADIAPDNGMPGASRPAAPAGYLAPSNVNVQVDNSGNARIASRDLHALSAMFNIGMEQALEKHQAKIDARNRAKKYV